MSRLGPNARAALFTVIDQAWRAGRHGRKVPEARDWQQMHDYACGQLETALILDTAEAQTADSAAAREPG